MDEASKILENLTTSQPHLPNGYQNISPDPPLVGEVIDHNSSLVNPTLFERESHETFSNQPLVEKKVDLIPPLVDHTFPIESDIHTAQVLLVSSYSNEIEGSPPINKVQGSSYPIPIAQGDNSPILVAPPPSSMVPYFDWSRLT